MIDATNIKKYIMLGGVAVALLLIPRRSSQKSDTKHPNKTPVKKGLNQDNAVANLKNKD